MRNRGGYTNIIVYLHRAVREAFPREPAEGTTVFRKDLIELLLMRPMSIQQIARLLEERPRDVEDDLHHLLKSLKKSPYRAVVSPARYRKCDFRFHYDKLHKPGKCPRCHETWISEQLIEIRERAGGKR